MKDSFKSFKNRVAENFKQNKIAVIAMLLIWIAVIVFTLFFYKDSLGKLSVGNEYYDHVVELCNGVKIKEVLPVEEGSDTIAIKFATFARKNKGTFTVTISGADSKKVYAEKTIKVSSLQDNAFTTFVLSETMDPLKEAKLSIELTSDCEEGQGAGVYYSEMQVFEDSRFSIDGELMPHDLSLRFLKESEELRLFYRLIITWVITTFTLIVLMILLVKPKYETLFALIAIFFGITFLFVITPMSVPDETVHYEYSFQMSNYMMGKDHLIFDEEYQDYGSFGGHLNVSVAYERLIKKFNRPLHLTGRNIKMNYDIDESYYTCFVPQALGITLARLLNFNMLRTFYLGRLFNLIFYIFCVHIAIKKTPVFKLLFGIIATLPVFMQQAASFSYDCFINGLSFVVIAFLMKWMHQKEVIDIKEFILLFIADFLLSPMKIVYGMFLFLFWFVPEERFGSRRNKIIAMLIIMSPSIYQLADVVLPLVFRVIRKIFENLFPAAVTAETIDQPVRAFLVEGEVYTFSYVMNHPLEALQIILRTIRYGLKNWFYGSFGRALSGDSLILPTLLVHSLLGVLVISALRQEEKTGTLLFRACILAICVLGGLMIVGGMLVSWTEINQEVIADFGGPVIQGVQGRYFSPFLPYVFLCLNNPKFKISKKADPYILYVFLIIVFEVVVYVLSYTFMN